ncbi:hypothetical protein ACO0QE_003775 [Hanseniaspora vineae]
MNSIKKLSSMLKREYLKTVDAKSIRFYKTLEKIEPKDIASLTQFQLSFGFFITELQKSHASSVPVILLKVLSVASRNRHEDIFDWILSNCMKNKQFFTYLDYVQLEQIIAERLFLRHDLLGLITFVENARHMKLNIKSFKALNETFLSRFPFLGKAVYPEYRILFSDPTFQEVYPWCNIFLSKHHFEHSVDAIVKRKLTMLDDSNDLKNDGFFFDDLSTADKLKSSYMILKKYVNNRRGMKHIDESQIDGVFNFVKKLFEEGHFRYQNELPLKFQMLQIEIQALRTFRKMSRSEKKGLRKKMYTELIDSFVTSKRLILRSDDYLRLANLVSKRPFKDFEYAKLFLNKSLENINTHTNNNAFELAKNWYKFYMTSLKISVQSHDITFFVQLVKDWNANKDAFYILPECVTDLKGFQKYWIKRKDFLLTSAKENSNFSDNLHIYEDFLSDIELNIGQLKQRYVDYEYDGLNTMQQLVQSIKVSSLGDAGDKNEESWKIVLKTKKEMLNKYNFDLENEQLYNGVFANSAVAKVDADDEGVIRCSNCHWELEEDDLDECPHCSSRFRAIQTGGALEPSFGTGNHNQSDYSEGEYEEMENEMEDYRRDGQRQIHNLEAEESSGSESDEYREEGAVSRSRTNTALNPRARFGISESVNDEDHFGELDEEEDARLRQEEEQGDYSELNGFVVDDEESLEEDIVDDGLSSQDSDFYEFNESSPRKSPAKQSIELDTERSNSNGDYESDSGEDSDVKRREMPAVAVDLDSEDNEDYQPVRATKRKYVVFDESD